MTKKTWIILIIALIAVLVIGVVVGVVYQTQFSSSRYVLDEPYQFPEDTGILMGTWESKMSMNIPEEQLKIMTTKALVETLPDYPYLSNISIFGEYRSGFLQTKDIFNGLEELTKRKDRSDELFNLYRTLKEQGPAEGDEEGFVPESIEVILVQPEFYDLLSDAQKQELEELAGDSHYYKLALEEKNYTEAE